MSGEEVGLLAQVLKYAPDIGSDTPCRRNPRGWDGDDPANTAAAIEACETRCAAYDRCRSWALAEERPLCGVIAGIRYPLQEAVTS